jgi:hypothetical protein
VAKAVEEWMGDKVEIDIDEIRRVFEIIEQIHDFIHQPLNYSDIESFAMHCYPELHEVYYKVVWNWLPTDVQKFYKQR